MFLTFYQDNQFQETFTQYARKFENLFDLAYVMGYKPQVTGVATVDLDFYQNSTCFYFSPKPIPTRL